MRRDIDEAIQGWPFDPEMGEVIAREVRAKDGRPLIQIRVELGLLQLEVIGRPDGTRPHGFVTYLDARRRDNGSFNNTPAAAGGDGHVMNTLWGLEALRALGRAGEKRAEACRWLRACQRPGGGFTWQPEPEFGGTDDVAYTRAAVAALRLLGGGPADRDGCVRYLWSLRNADGGFGPRPGPDGRAGGTPAARAGSRRAPASRAAP